MKIIQNVPDGIYRRILQNVQKPDPNVLRVTELINPPIIKKLTLEFWDELKPLASEFLWSLLGSAMHREMAEGQEDESDSLRPINRNTLIEERWTVDLPSGVKLTGQIDLYATQSQTIIDYKCTSCGTFCRGLKPEWEAQLNLYRFLLETATARWGAGHKVKHLQIHAILRDWQVGRSHNRDYPSIPFMVITVPVWPESKINNYIEERVAVHQAEPLPCSMQERWQNPPCYVIKQKGRKSAVMATIKASDGSRVTMTREQAQSQMELMKKKNLYVEERPSVAVRCKDYCLCRNVCPYNPYREA